MSGGETEDVSTLIPRIETLERRSNQFEKDIRAIYDQLSEHSLTLRSHSRELRWLRHGVTSLLVHMGLDLPPDEPADEAE